MLIFCTPPLRDRVRLSQSLMIHDSRSGRPKNGGSPNDALLRLTCMRYQYKREPLTGDEASRLANACNPHEEKLVVWTLLDTGLRVSELANLKRANRDWQTHRLMIYGKGGP